MNPPPSTLRAFVTPPGAGDVLNVVGEKMHVLASTESTGGATFVILNETGPGAGPPLHRHLDEDEYFYVLEGTFRFRVDGKDFDAPPGAFIFAPRGSRHTFVNTGERAGRMLVWVSPARIEPAFRACDAAGLTPADGPRLVDTFAKVGLMIEGPPLAK